MNEKPPQLSTVEEVFGVVQIGGYGISGGISPPDQMIPTQPTLPISANSPLTDFNQAQLNTCRSRPAQYR